MFVFLKVMFYRTKENIRHRLGRSAKAKSPSQMVRVLNRTHSLEERGCPSGTRASSDVPCFVSPWWYEEDGQMACSSWRGAIVASQVLVSLRKDTFTRDLLRSIGYDLVVEQML